MKVVVAIDSLKGSLTSLEAGNAAKEGILRAMPEIEVVVKPLADGGEGTVDAFIEGEKGTRITMSVTGPMGGEVKCCYGILEDGRTAVMEMAQASGITLVAENERNPMQASTYGVGEMIRDAVYRGCRYFIMGIGGSATNDGGIGMLSALGFRFLDSKGQSVFGGARELSRIVAIRADGALPELAECEFQIACDVRNPLCGKNGATYIYGPQKGLPHELCDEIDKGMKHYAEVAELFCGKTCRDIPGAGAAGGLGFAFLAFLNGTLVPGVELVLETIHLEQEIKNARFVVTGEGRLDAQTAMGKAPAGVAKIAKQYGCQVLAFTGEVTEEAKKCNETGIDAFFPIVRGVANLEDAMRPENAKRNMADAVEQVFRLISVLL